MLIYLSKFTLIYSVVLTLLSGAVLGSFLNCAAFRIARGEPFARGRSHCPVCHHVLGAVDLIPVLSWSFLGGKCRYCKTRISARYPLTELVMAVISLLTLLRCDISWLFLRNLIFASALFCLSLVDLEIYEIPDGTHLVSVIAWLIFLPLIEATVKQTILSGAAGALFLGGGVLAISLVFDKLLGKESMGGGDIKLLAVAGLYLGVLKGLFALILACLLGLAFMVLRKKLHPDAGERIPFGPSIAAAVWIMLLYGDAFVNWYLSLII